MHDDLRIIFYPDPRLKKVSAPVERFDESLAELARRMLELMHASRGVGLAAPQVGHNIRMFVLNPDGEPEHDRVYVNPVLTDASGEEEAEEGCLSLPGIHLDVNRHRSLHMRAQDLTGQPFEERAEGYLARIWQHETDHLNGVLLLDRMGPVARMANRRTIREMEEKWAEEHPEQQKKAKRR